MRNIASLVRAGRPSNLSGLNQAGCVRGRKVFPEKSAPQQPGNTLSHRSWIGVVPFRSFRSFRLFELPTKADTRNCFVRSRPPAASGGGGGEGGCCGGGCRSKTITPARRTRNSGGTTQDSVRRTQHSVRMDHDSARRSQDSGRRTEG